MEKLLMVIWTKGTLTESAWKWIIEGHGVPIEIDLDREVISISFQEVDLINVLRGGIVPLKTDGEFIIIGLNLFNEEEIEKVKHDNQD